MIPRAVLLASFLPFSALAQLQVFEFNGTTDTPVGTVLIMGAGLWGIFLLHGARPAGMSRKRW